MLRNSVKLMWHASPTNGCRFLTGITTILSILAWVPINESWGVPNILTDKAQQEHAKAMVHMIHSIDQTRLVVDNDGWEHTDATDLFTLHDYARTGEELVAKYGVLETDKNHIPRNERDALVEGYKWNETPFLMTEFGGIAYRAGASSAANRGVILALSHPERRCCRGWRV